MLARMNAVDARALEAFARAVSFTFTPDEAAALRPLLDRTLELLERLETLPIAAVEPATHFRILPDPTR
jgi:hypothetical protein